ncbi:MAG: phosphoenolpyruvate--protein phosphotransferase [Desulfurococcaceae archaeon]
MQVARGTPASEGYAIARARVIRARERLEAPQDCRASEGEDGKLERALSEYLKLVGDLAERAPQADRELFETYALMAQAIVEEARGLVWGGMCAEGAIAKVYEKYAGSLLSSSSELIRLREQDLRDIASSLIALASGSQRRGAEDVRGAAVIAEELSPADFMRLADLGMAGLATSLGGITSHVAILARARGIPYVIAPGIHERATDGALVIIDGFDGKVLLEPDEAALARYRELSSAYEAVKGLLRSYAHRPARTLDGVDVEVLCNVGNIEDARVASGAGCDGVGLFRVEFMYMGERPPSEEALREAFERVAGLFGGRPVVVRAPDLGADKPMPYFKFAEPNPFLGLRGIRLLLAQRDMLLRPFLRAVLGARAKFENVKVMIPMVSRTSEVAEFLDELQRVAEHVGLPDLAGRVELGLMIETPAAALMVDRLAKVEGVKFVSFGTNDLAQYVLAADRANPAVQAIYDDMDPSVLRLIRLASERARASGLRVEACGELAGRPLAVPLLIAMGITSLSVNPRYVGVVKYVASNVSATRARDAVEDALRAAGPEEVRARARAFAQSFEGLRPALPWLG